MPATKTISEAATAPLQAKAPNSRVGLGERSTSAPTTMSRIAEMIVEMVSV